MLERNLAYGIGIAAAVLFFAIYYIRVYAPESKKA